MSITKTLTPSPCSGSDKSCGQGPGKPVSVGSLVSFVFIWLGVAVVAGLALGLSQQLRGAHYMSHTLWTAWVCWAVGFAIDVAVTRPNHRKLPESAAPLHAST